MTDTLATIEQEDPRRRGDAEEDEGAMALVIAWSASEPHRVGEVAFIGEGTTLTLGRGGSEEAGRAAFVRQRPGEVAPTPPLQGPGISRDQLRVRARQGTILVESVGRCPMLAQGAAAKKTVLEPGDTIELKGQLVLLCARRPASLPPLRDFPASAIGPFGEPDAHGFLGEGPAAWTLRDRLAWNAKAGANLLLLGESGAGKELAARAVHALSARSKKTLVARNAATIPTELVDAELFGNVKGYPNPGMPDRPGLIGHADGGTLFLDEIGELPQSLQAHLLRVLDAGGEYHRLGEALARRADIRLIAATNRAPDTLKHDLLARLPLRVSLPGLEARREDIPLLARHLLCRALDKSPDLVGRFMTPSGEPRIEASLITHLLHRRYTTHVRELDALLWRAMSTSPGDSVALPAEALTEAAGAPASEAKAPPSKEVPEPSAEQIRASLAECGATVQKAARALGLSSRYALYRLIRKHGIETKEGEAGDE